ncbi:MAG TPA: PQQ-binding-like beta-propeller repeat protein [Urbifossiella sp.]|jgi:outer membrane protein assembly factor BamB|nr:PQQ-binding-like beta-propeller repeat protein [Urbifossiella sp.]
MRFALAVAAAGLALAPAPSSDRWPAFRGPTADGVSDAKNPPTAWSEKKNIVWKTPVHGKGWASPVVADGRVWVTTADEERGTEKAKVPTTGGAKGPVKKVTFFAVCTDLATGRVVHDVKLAEEADPAFCHDFNSYASPTPVIDGGKVYAHFGSHGTWCLDAATGQVLWERRDLKCDHFRGPGSSPVVYGDWVFLIFDGFDQQYVIALDKTTGSTVWRQDRRIRYGTDNGDYKKAYATPRLLVVDGKAQLVCPSAEATIAYDPKTGDELWRFHHLKKQTMNVAAPPVAGHGLTYLVSGYPAQLMALKQTATGTVGKDAVAWDTDKGVPTRPSLLLVKDLLVMVSDGGVVSCLDAKTGKQHWTERLNGQYTASPVSAAGLIYLPNEGGKTTVIRAAADYEVVGTNDLDAGCMASPALVGNTLLLRTKTHLYAIGAK